MIRYPDLHDPDKLRQIIAECDTLGAIMRRVGCGRNAAYNARRRYHEMTKTNNTGEEKHEI